MRARCAMTMYNFGPKNIPLTCVGQIHIYIFVSLSVTLSALAAPLSASVCVCVRTRPQGVDGWVVVVGVCVMTTNHTTKAAAAAAAAAATPPSSFAHRIDFYQKIIAHEMARNIITGTRTRTPTHTQAHIRTRGRRHRYLCNSGHRAVHHQHHPTSAHARTGTALIRRGCVCV